MSVRAEHPDDVHALLRQSRTRELGSLELLLGLGDADVLDGMRIARVAAEIGVGATTLLDLLAERRPADAPVLRIDPRRCAELPELLEPCADRRTLLLVDHAWESDLAAAAVGGVVDALDPSWHVSILLVARTDASADAGTWSRVLDELAERAPMPSVELSAPPLKTLGAVLARRHPMLTDALRGHVLELSGGVPRIAMLVATSGGRGARSMAEWVHAELEPLDADVRERLLVLAHVEDGLHETALGGPVSGAPFIESGEQGAWRVEPAAVRDALRAGASAAHARACIAEAIERTEDATSVADRADRARLLSARGDRAAARVLWKELAIEHEQAGRLVEAGIARRHEIATATDTKTLLEALHAAARTFREHGVQSASEHALTQLRRVADRAGADELVAWAIRELAFTRGDVTLLDSAELQASDAGWAWEARAAAADNAAEYEQVLHFADEALTRARSAGDELLELRARDLLASACVELPPGHGRRRAPETAVQELGEIINRAWTAGHRHRALLAAHTEAYVTRLTARFDRSEQRLAAHMERARAAGRPNHLVSLGAYRAEALTQLARLEEAAALCTELRATLDPSYVDRYDEAFLQIVELMVRVERRIDDGLGSALADMRRRGLLDLHVTLRVAWELVGMRLAAATGNVVAVTAHVAALRDLETPADDRATAAADLARVGAVTGDEQTMDLARSLLDGVSADDDLPLVERAREEALACIDRDDAALARCVDRWRELGCELRALRAELTRAQLTANADQAWLRDLKARLRAAGMRDAEDAVNVLLRAGGHAARAAARPRGDAPLTEREEQVARLVVTGLTNREVAERLGVKPATIARILANVYERHELPGRTALVSLLASLDEQRGA